jgi:hypothetical protein
MCIVHDLHARPGALEWWPHAASVREIDALSSECPSSPCTHAAIASAVADGTA